MNEVTQALAYIGAYSLGILTLLGAITYLLKASDRKAAKRDEMAMAEAVGVVKTSMPGSQVLDYSGTQE